MADIIQLANEFRAALLKKERKAAVRLIEAYDAAWARLERELSKLTAQIQEARARGEVVNQFWLARQQRYFELLRQVDQEMRKFSDVAETTITRQQAAAAKAGLRDSLALMEEEAGSTGVRTAFNRLPVAAVENMVGFLGDGSPLRSLLDQIPRAGRAIVEDGLIQAVALGIGPAATARKIREGLDGNKIRALMIARTETLRAYRQASLQTYQANADALTGWVWRSSRSRRSCAACIALDGTFHPVNRPMLAHARCRCTMIPAVRGVEVDKGVDWFKKQPVDVKRSILGTDKAYEAIKRGDLKLEDLVGLQRNAQWGDSYVQIGVKRALAGEGAFPQAAVKPFNVLPPTAPSSPRPARRSVQTNRGAGPRIRAKLDKINAQARQTRKALVTQRENLIQQILNTNDLKQKRALDRKLQTVSRKTLQASIRELRTKREAVFQSREANFKVVNKPPSAYLKENVKRGIDAFKRMIGPNTALTSARKITIKQIRGRAYYGGNAIHLDPSDDIGVVIHELGHWLEESDADIHKEIIDFYTKRTTGDQIESLATLTGNNNYRPREVAKKDRWLKPYMGRWYANAHGEQFATEILSMGLEEIYNDPYNVAKNDPDFFDFIIELVRRKRKP